MELPKGTGTIVSLALAATLLGGCAVGTVRATATPKNPAYIITEHALNNLSLGFSYQYDVERVDDGKPLLLYTMTPLNGERVKDAFLADDYEVRDSAGNDIYRVDGKVLSISAKHSVFDANGNEVYIMDQKAFGGLIGRLGRMALGRDGYYLRDANGEEILAIRETWTSALLPLARDYIIVDPQTGNEIGEIRAGLRLGSIFLNAQTYYVTEKPGTSLDPSQLATMIRMIDGREDLETGRSSSSQ